MPSYPTGATLDAPDTTIRRIMQKRADGQRLTDRELTRLGTRQSVEAETARTGGTVSQSIQPRRITPYDQGVKDQQSEDDYAAGREGRANPAATANDSAGLRRPGPIDVNSYRGSRYAAPGSYSEARPLANETPARRIAPPPAVAIQRPVEAPGLTRANPNTVGFESAPAAPRAAPEDDLGAPEKLSSPVAPSVGAGADDSFVGGGGSYMARFKTKRSAKEFADFAARASAQDSTALSNRSPFVPRRVSS